MKKPFSTLLLLLIPIYLLFAQDEKRANVWYFGAENGIDFNSDPPRPLLDGALWSTEGCASISDLSGQLLFYTNGENIWNSNHQVMEGGDNLEGHQSVTQVSIILPSLTSDTQYYVFYMNQFNMHDPAHGPGELFYAIVDMAQNNGLGKVISRGNSLRTHCTEKLTAIRHCNGKDFWIISHERFSNNFLVWRLSEAGVSAMPIISSVGLEHQIPWGYMKGSPLGDKLALSNYRKEAVEVFDFDKETGIISNPITFQGEMYKTSYGLAFSPNGRRLYIANTVGEYLLQVNLALPTNQDILSSTVLIANSPVTVIQNAPNGKLYINSRISNLSVIHAPNELGLACDFRENDFSLGKQISGEGLPNFPSIYFREKNKIDVIEATENCEGMRELNAITNIGGDSIVYNWYYENELIPNESFTSIQINDNGLYKFEALVYTNCKTVLKEYTETIDVQFDDIIPLSINDITTEIATCNEANGSVSFLGEGGKGTLVNHIDNGLDQEETSFDGLAGGRYTITLMDERACSVSQEIVIDEFSSPKFMEISTKATLCGEASGGFAVDVDGGFGQLSVAFDNVPLSEEWTRNNLEAGEYNLVVKDEAGCQVDTTITITQFNCPFYIPNAFSPNSDGTNDWFEISKHPDFDGVFEALHIYDRWGNLLFKTQNLDRTEFRWDGKFQGKPLPIGVYMYVLKYNYFGSTPELASGTVNLLK